MKAFSAFFFMVFIGCQKEQITEYTANLSNTTMHTIAVSPYFNGVVAQTKVITLNANSNFQIADGTERGIVNEGGFDSNYLSGSDSIIVTFDNLYHITHYAKTPTSFAPKYYPITGGRSLYSIYNYAYHYRDLNKSRRESSYQYSFTEQDFVDSH